MPVYLYTIHGYRTRMPNHPDGYSRKDQSNLPPDEVMNACYENRAKFDEIRFDGQRQKVVVEACIEVASTLTLRPYYLVCVSTHLHALVGWTDKRDWTSIHDRLKSIVALKLARSENVEGRRWLCAGRDGERVEEPKHFTHLMTEYLPGHAGYTFVDPRAMEDARAYARGF